MASEFGDRTHNAPYLVLIRKYDELWRGERVAERRAFGGPDLCGW